MLKKIFNYYKIKTIKGYKKAKKKKLLRQIEILKDDLTNTKIEKINSNLELPLRQFLLRYLINFRFNISIFHSLSDQRSIIYPLPKEWITVLEEKNFKVNKILSLILLYFLSIFFFFKSFKTFFLFLIYSNNYFPNSKYNCFIKLTKKFTSRFRRIL